MHRGPRSDRYPQHASVLRQLAETLHHLRQAFPIRTSPRRIALGVSIGLFVASLPAIGFQMGLALLLAWTLNASRPAAMLAVWVTNPWTMGVAYALTYHVGHPFWFAQPDASLVELSRAIHGGHNPLAVDAVFVAFRNMFGLGTGLYVPMLIGGVIVGIVAALVAYFPAYTIATYAQRMIRPRTSRRSRAATGSTRAVGAPAPSRTARGRTPAYRRAA